MYKQCVAGVYQRLRVSHMAMAQEEKQAPSVTPAGHWTPINSGGIVERVSSGSSCYLVSGMIALTVLTPL